jgi:hypothetical protein
MRYFYDTEFLEDGHTVLLISIGIAAEDGREYYAVNQEIVQRKNERRIRQHDWLMANVVPTLPKPRGDWNLHMPKSWLFDYHSPLVRPKARIASEVSSFLLADDKPELWAYYGAYDHVALCQLWGRMIDLPAGVPMFTHELMQLWEQVGRPEKPAEPQDEHNALADARWNRTLFEACRGAL